MPSLNVHTAYQGKESTSRALDKASSYSWSKSPDDPGLLVKLYTLLSHKELTLYRNTKLNNYHITLVIITCTFQCMSPTNPIYQYAVNSSPESIIF
jgi:hypothetical protein